MLDTLTLLHKSLQKVSGKWKVVCFGLGGWGWSWVPMKKHPEAPHNKLTPWAGLSDISEDESEADPRSCRTTLGSGTRKRLTIESLNHIESIEATVGLPDMNISWNWRHQKSVNENAWDGHLWINEKILHAMAIWAWYQHVPTRIIAHLRRWRWISPWLWKKELTNKSSWTAGSAWRWCCCSNLPGIEVQDRSARSHGALCQPFRS